MESENLLTSVMPSVIIVPPQQVISEGIELSDDAYEASQQVNIVEETTFTEDTTNQVDGEDAQTTGEENERENDGLIESEQYAHYRTWPTHILSLKYLRLLKSPSFFLTFGLAVFSRFSAVVDVGTDFAQAFDHWRGKARYICENTTIANLTNIAPTLSTITSTISSTATMYNFTDASIYATYDTVSNVTDHQQHPWYIPRDPSWFAITLGSIYLPALICVTRHSIQNLQSQFLYHRFRLICEEVKENQQIFTGNVFLQKLLFFVTSPFLIVLRQFRQLLLKLEIELIEQTYSKLMNTGSFLKRICRSLCCCCCMKNTRAEESDEDRVAQIIHDVLSDPNYIPPVRTELADQLISLSVDRHDEALLETTPQTVLNLMVMFRYGSNFLRQLSLSFSFYSLVSSAAAYTVDKLKLNPVKRELNTFGQFMAFLIKFPVTLSRCIVLSILYSTHNILAKLACTLLFVAYGLVAIAIEYYNIEEDHRFISSQLMLHLFIRGYTSIFTLMEYRIKRTDENGQIIDEADLEAKEGKRKDPPSRFRDQLVYLIINCIINALFAVWFYYFSGEQICATGFFIDFVGKYVPGLTFDFVVDVRFFWTIVMIAGAPISLCFTILMNIRTVQSFATTLGMKAIEAINYHVRTIIKKGNADDIRELIPMLRNLSEGDFERVTKIELPNENSVLYQCAISKQSKPIIDLRLPTQFYYLGFPITDDFQKMISSCPIHTVSNSLPDESRSIRSSFVNTTTSDPQFSTILKIPPSFFSVAEHLQDRMRAYMNSSVMVAEGVMYVIGGEGVDNKFLISYNLFDHTSTLVPTTGHHPPELYGSSCTLIGDFIYMFGGMNSKIDLTNNLYMLNTITHEWDRKVSKGETPPPQYRCVSWCWDDELWLLGGESPIMLNTLHKFNIRTNTWKQMETVDTPDIRGGSSGHGRFASHCLIGDVVYVYDRTETLYKLDMKTLTWSVIHHSPTNLHENILLVLGGEIYN